MHKLKNVILLTSIIHFSFTSIAMIDVKEKYQTKFDIKSNNRVTKKTTLSNIPPVQMELVDSELVWGSHNNPVNKPLFNDCYLAKDVADKLNNLRAKYNFRLLNCYISANNLKYIRNNLSKQFVKSEYGKLSTTSQLLSISRESGRIFDIEFLDKHGNKLVPENKYLNTKTYSNKIDISNFGFKRVTNYPWIWEG